jgi:hypothetical protein
MSTRRNFNPSNRGRSPSRGRGFRGRGLTGFFSQETQKEEADKLDNTRKDVEDLNKYVDTLKVTRSQPSQQSTISKSNEKVNKTIDAGKEFISKFFKGFSQPDRGNIKVTLDSKLPSRMIDPYISKIKSFTELKYQNEPDAKFRKYFLQFKGITEIGIAIKLHKSSTEFQKNLNFKLSSIRNLDLPLPKKLNVLINQLGKTDLPNDNRIRLKQQHLLVKRFMLRGSAIFLQKDIDQYLENNNTFKSVIDILDNPLYFDRCLDNSLGSLSLLKSIGKEFFLQMSDHNFEFQLAEKEYKLRLPSFPFNDEEGITVEDIIKYFNNPLFTDFEFSQEAIFRLIASLVFQVTKFSWIKNRDKTISELEPKFADTVIKDYVFQDILDYADISFIDQYIQEDVLDDVVNEVIKIWKTGSLTIFSQMFNMEEVRFSEYGSDSQLIEIKEFRKVDNELDIPTFKIKNRCKSESTLKTSEHGAILGTILAISKKVEFSSKFEINYDSKNDQILQEFVKSDFKT